MEKDLFAIRFHEARTLAGLSMDKLVARSNGVVTKQSISCYEKGIMRPKRYTLRVLAQAMDISPEYFSGNALQIDMPLLRTALGEHVDENELAVLEARLAFRAEQYLKAEARVEWHNTFENPIAGKEVRTLDDAIQAADQLREGWHCGDGPLPHLLRLLERKGILVVPLDLPEGILGVSTWVDGKYPLMALDMRKKRTTTERLRFTAAHELGHLLLTLPDDSDLSQEKRCDKFASFFLFPKQTFIEELGCPDGERQLSLEELSDLKELYGISIASLVHEAYDLGLISRTHYDWWYDHRIHQNRLETGWGEYPYEESVGREKRMRAAVPTLMQSH